MADRAEPCPHCGTKAHIESASDDGAKYARCGDANCRALRFVPLEVWNNRPIEDALRERAIGAEGNGGVLGQLQDAFKDTLDEVPNVAGVAIHNPVKKTGEQDG